MLGTSVIWPTKGKYSRPFRQFMSVRRILSKLQVVLRARATRQPPSRRTRPRPDVTPNVALFHFYAYPSLDQMLTRFIAVAVDVELFRRNVQLSYKRPICVSLNAVSCPCMHAPPFYYCPLTVNNTHSRRDCLGMLFVDDGCYL